MTCPLEGLVRRQKDCLTDARIGVTRIINALKVSDMFMDLCFASSHLHSVFLSSDYTDGQRTKATEIRYARNPGLRPRTNMYILCI